MASFTLNQNNIIITFLVPDENGDQKIKNVTLTKVRSLTADEVMQVALAIGRLTRHPIAYVRHVRYDNVT